jgi:monoamine oxidase
MGPQFIQDPGINPWMKIAEDLEFETLVPPATATIYRVREDKVWLDKKAPGPKATDQASKALDAFYEKAVEQADDEPNLPACPKPDEIDADTQLALSSNGLGSVGESAEPWQYIASDSARQADVAMKDSGVVFVKRGLGSLVAAFGEHLEEEYDDDLEVKLGQIVTRIQWNPNDNDIELFSGYNSILTADYCIVTVPCSAVPRIAFVPPLAPKRVVANQYIMLGSYKKVAFIPETMPASIAENTDYYMYDYELEGCWQYFRLPTAPTALIGVASGNFAAALDRLENAEAAAAFIHALTAAYQDELVVGEETVPLVTNWSQQQNIWGAYSYTRYDGGDAENPTAFDAREEIGEPHADGLELFAGEATWTDAYATIHGAYNSGVRAANEILNAVGLL